MSRILEEVNSWLERLKSQRIASDFYGLARKIKKEAEFGRSETEEVLVRRVQKLVHQISRNELSKDESVFQIFTVVSLLAERFFGFFPNETQIIAALCLMDGKVVELRTGEGKTLVAALAASCMVLLGRHVDIATTNDYLAERDYRTNGLLFAALGISSGLVTSTMPREERKAEYQKSITYASNQELGFDYLNDNLVLSPDERVMRALDAVIIDEADSVLIDEARTSLIIARQAAREVRKDVPSFSHFLNLVNKLEPEVDYTIDRINQSVAFTDQGVSRVIMLLKRDIFSEASPVNLRGLWYSLYAHIFWKENQDYIIKDGKVILVDAFTGHALPNRRLMHGLHQAVQAISGVPVTPDDDVTGTTTYRNFFRLYKTVAGMTGTAYEARDEFSDLYKLDVVVLSPYRRAQRRDFPTIFFRTLEEKFLALVDFAQKVQGRKAPLLIVGTSIELATECSRVLTEHNLSHQMLHAAVKEDEREVFERAGGPGAITIATNIAGRGADIIIDKSFQYNYGLAVIGMEHNFSPRVDNQLRGRSGRQGQYGETQFLASLEDELFQIYGDDTFWKHAENLAWAASGLISQKLSEEVLRLQLRAQSLEKESRKWLARFDDVLDVHRTAMYKLRREILESEDVINHVIYLARHILLVEEFSRIEKSDLKLLLQQSAQGLVGGPVLEAILAGGTLTSNTLKQARILAETIRNIRSRLLLTADDRWRRYLESIDWLEDWVSLTAAGDIDPYVFFIETADRMFHDMRRDFAISALRIILEKTPLSR